MDPGDVDGEKSRLSDAYRKRANDRLHEIARVLGCSVDDFFVPEQPADPDDGDIQTPHATEDDG